MSSLQFGEFLLDRHARVLSRGTTVLPVSGKAFDLLSYMVENPGRPLLKSELLQAVWPETTVEESNLSQNVFLLRKVLGSRGDGPIKTLAGRGYQFVGQVTELQSSGPAGVFQAPSSTPASSVSLETTRTQVVMEGEEQLILTWQRPLRAFAIMLALAGITGFFAYRHLQVKGGVASSAAPPVAVMATRPAVAFLGFRNASNRPEDGWLSTAVTEMLSNDVSSADTLRVIPTEEVSRAQVDLGTKGGAVHGDAALAGVRQATGADLLVQGSYVVVNHGNTPALRLMVEVEDAHTGRQMASFSETGEVGGLFHLVDQAGTELRRDLSDHRPEEESGSALAGMSQNADALRLYAEAVDEARLFDSNSARELFERAIQADPNFTMAHLGLANAWVDLGFLERGAKEARIAFEQSPGLPRVERLAIEAEYRNLSKDDEKAITLYKALFTFYPDNEAWGMDLAEEETDAGRERDAIGTLERLRSLPLTPAQRVEVNAHEAFASMQVTTPEGQAKARNLVAEALAIAEKQPGLLVRGEALRAQCLVLATIGPDAHAVKACEQVKSTYQAVGNLEAVAAAVMNLAGIAGNRNDWKAEEDGYAEARHLFHDLGNVSGEYSAIYNLGLTHLEMGELPTAIGESAMLAHAKDTGDNDNFVFYGNLYAGTALRYEGKLQQAQTSGHASLRAAVKEADKKMDGAVFNQALAQELLADIALEAGEYAQAHRAFDEAALLLKPTNQEFANADLLTAESELLVEEGHPTKAAMDALRNIVKVFEKDPREVDNKMRAKVYLAEMDLETGQIHEAAVHLAGAEALDGKGSWEETHLQRLLANADLQIALRHGAEAATILQGEISEAGPKGYAYLGLKGEIALAKLSEKTAPSWQSAARRTELAHRAERAGFKELAQEALTHHG